MTGEELHKLWWGRYVENYPHEMLNLVNIVETLNPLEIIIEIGVKQCGTLRLWERTVPVGGMVIGVDMDSVETITAASGRSTQVSKEPPPFSQHQTEEFWDNCPSSFLDWQTCTDGLFDAVQSDRQIHFVIGDSNSQGVHDQIKSILGGRKADFIFHDGGHYDDVPQKDFDNIVLPFLRAGGLFALADIRDDGGKALCQNFPPSHNPVQVVPPNRAGIALWWKP